MRAHASEPQHGTASRGGCSLSRGWLLQRRCAGEHTSGPCPTCRAHAAPTPAGHAPPIVHDVLRSSGQPLDRGARAFMEARLARDFSQVRVHTDARAADSARAVGAAAYTVGRDLVFASGQYAPHSPAGRRILAHELTHVVQQEGAGGGAGGSLPISQSNSGPERDADAVASTIDADAPRRPGVTSPRAVQRDEPPINRERSTQPRLQLQLNPPDIQFSLEVLRGQHVLDTKLGLRAVDIQQLNALGFGRYLDTAQVYGSLGYTNRCNRALQNALIGAQVNPFVDVARIPWQLEGRVGIRIGSWQISPGPQVSFVGRDFERFLLTVNVVANVETRTPTECIGTPEPPRPQPDRPGGGGEGPGGGGPDRPGGGPDRPGGGRDRPDAGPPSGSEPPPRTRPTIPGPSTLYFFYDSTLLRPESEGPFQALVTLLQNVPSLQVRLTGHASLEGTPSYNLDLSKRRAAAMASRLVTAGIAPGRIGTDALGEASPAVPEPPVPRRTLMGPVEEARNMNRRVEVQVIDPTGTYLPTRLELRTPELRFPRSGRGAGRAGFL